MDPIEPAAAVSIARSYFAMQAVAGGLWWVAVLASNERLVGVSF